MAPESSTPEAAEASTEADGRGWLRMPRPLVIAFSILFAAPGGIIFIGNSLSPPPQANPQISIELAPAQAAVPNVDQTALRAPRSLTGHLVSDPALIEDTALGPLPVVARDGRMAMQVYANAVERSDKRPRIAVVITGLNVGGTTTKAALMNLRPEISLGFSPFGADAQSSVDRAREAGHEVLVEVPMEPFDFPESDPGPHALLVAAGVDENVRRLMWSMSRITGYVGVMNLLGGRFLGEQNAIEPVLSETARRGLLFFDDGANASSLALTAARHMKAPIATGTLMLDTIQSREAIDKKLVELEAEARRNGSAIGVGSVYPITIARIAEWAGSVNARGLALVPISALAGIPAPQEAGRPAGR
jgi:polysaccharide deacetylase 2 family uncharacterized protein YibQ